MSEDYAKMSSIQDLCDLVEIIKVDRWKYNRNKILYDAIVKCLKEDTSLNETLREKVSDMLSSWELKDCMDSCLNQDELKLLEMGDFLTYDEQIELRASVTEMLRKWNDEMMKLLEKWGGADTGNNSSSFLSLTIEDKLLIDYKKKLNCLHKSYLENLQIHHSLLEQIVELRLKRLPEVTDENIEKSDLQTKMYCLRMEMFDQKNRIEIFTETSTSIAAYTALIQDIHEQQKSCRQEIDKLEEMKMKYKQVSCKQYDEILKLYLQYKTATESKRLVYQQVKGK